MFPRILQTSFRSINRISNTSLFVKMERLTALETRAEKLVTQLRTFTNELSEIKREIGECKKLFETNKRKAINDEVKCIEEEQDGNFKKSKFDFTTNEEGYVVVYTDGACENNGKANARAGLGVWFGANHPLNVSEPVRRRATNNVGEIEACTRAIQIAHNAGVKKLLINTDSEFLINCVTQWMPKWKLNNWRTSKGAAVINKDELEELDTTIKLINDVKWKHVRGHSGNVGNEAADYLAREGARKYIKPSIK